MIRNQSLICITQQRQIGLKCHERRLQNRHCRLMSALSSFTSSSTSSSSSSLLSVSFSKDELRGWIHQLAARKPTPGGGSAAAVGAAIGTAVTHMAAVYSIPTNSKTTTSNPTIQTSLSVASSTPSKRLLAQKLKVACDNRLKKFLQLAHDDEVAFLQWQQASKKKDNDLTDEKQQQEQQLSALQDQARQIPTQVFEECYELILILNEYIPHHRSSQLLSDAKVGFHQLAGSARAAYQIILANTYSSGKSDKQDDLKGDCSNHNEQHHRMKKMLKHIHEMETNILKLDEI
jgi:methenyltetrahydrofolate cyclohydrolase